MAKIGLDQIIVKDNVRLDYKEIEELADSMEKRGQLQNVIVKKAPPDKNGDKKYELIAGHRRYQAKMLSFKRGSGDGEIEATVVTGDRLTLQLIENLQRSDLTARERERGIAQMIESGMTQKEIAAELSKGADYVSKHISAYKIRKKADGAKIDTSGIETFVLTEIASAKEEHWPMLLSYIQRDGGTREAVRKIMADYRGNKKTPQPQQEAKPDNNNVEWAEEPDVPCDWNEKPVSGSELNIDYETPDGEYIKVKSFDITKPEKQKPKHREPIRREDTDPDHLIVDLQSVFDKIYGYLERLKKKIADNGEESEEGIIAQYKIDAVYDIVAELHQVKKAI